jgi:3',5'-cyclic-AMP phosphodiesterase
MITSHPSLSAPNPPDQTGIVSWVHFGDLHMTTRGEQNYRDFLLLVDEVNRVMADSLSFAYLPGDSAEHGLPEEYELVCEGRELLRLPSFAIVGDHDVHSRSHNHYVRYMMPQTFYSFEVGSCRFFALDAFAFDDPRVFDISEGQLEWLAHELKLASVARKYCVVLLHCYPSELGKSAESLQRLLRRHDVCLVDMGHTHYNEIAHDGCTLYTATRSTGQIEEGPVGFSITNIDRGVVSWRFKALGEWPLVMITSPADERLKTDHAVSLSTGGTIRIRVKAWSDRPFVNGFAELANERVPLERVPRSALWQADLNVGNLAGGIYPLGVELTDEEGKTGRDEIRSAVNSPSTAKPELRAGLDRHNVVGAWPERGILGTQLGPNKNGRKW